MRTVDEAGKLGRAFRLGLAFAFGKRFCAQGVASDEARWITVHPNGRGTTSSGDKAKGQPVLIDGETGEVLGGMGGRFNGRHISSVPKRGKQEQHGAQAKIDRAHAKKPATERSHADKKREDGKAKMRSFIGDRHYEIASQLLSQVDERVRKTWENFESELKVDSTTKKRGEYSRLSGGISFNLSKDSKGDINRKPYETMFHEFGHNIDHLAGKKSGFGHGSYFSHSYQNGAFSNTLKQEVSDLVQKELNQLKESFKSAENTREWIEQHQDYFPSWEYKYLYENPHLVKPSIKLVYNAIGKRLLALPADEQSAISDIFEGASGAKIKSGWGHGASYWKRPGSLAAEAFANLFSTAVTNPKAYKRLKETLPNSVKIFEEMLSKLKGE